MNTRRLVIDPVASRAESIQRQAPDRAVDVVVQLATLDVPDADAWCSLGAGAIEKALLGEHRSRCGPTVGHLGVVVWIERDEAASAERYLARGACCPQVVAAAACEHSLIRAAPLPSAGVFAGAQPGLIPTEQWISGTLRADRLASGLHGGAVAAASLELGDGPGHLIIAIDAMTDKENPPAQALELIRRVCAGAARLYEHRFVRPLQARRALLARLSPTQRRIVPLLVDGLSEREIGEALGRSMHTIHDHTKTIYRELGVHSRLELRDQWVRHGGA